MFRNRKIRKQRSRFYRSIIGSNNLCFDIGANIGTRTALFLELGARVIAVEPNPACVARLDKNYRLQKNVTIIDGAVSDVSGTAQLLGSQKFSEMSTISTAFRDTIIAAGFASVEDYKPVSLTVKTLTL